MRQFYPSVDQESVVSAFEQHLKTAQLGNDINQSASMCLMNALSCCEGGRGIPIGPEISHLAADLVLRDLDSELREKFGESYFRYVDDIVLVLEPGRVQSTTNLIAQRLSRVGLELHDDKADVVDLSNWLDFGPTGVDGVEPQSLYALFFRIKAYVARNPELLSDLEAALRDEGIHLPLKRMRNFAARINWRQQLSLFFHRGWKVVRSISDETQQSLVNFALSVKKSQLQDLDKLLASEHLDTSVGRRWFSQKLRRLTNQLLYLCEGSDLGSRWRTRFSAIWLGKEIVIC